MLNKKIEYNYCYGNENINGYLVGKYELRTGIIMDKFNQARYESHFGKTEIATDEMYLVKRESGECDSISPSSITKILV